MSLGNVPDFQGQTRKCPCVPEVSVGTRTNPKMSLRQRTTMRLFKLWGQTRETQGQTQGQNISLFEERYLGSVPESSEEQVQEQGRLSYAPCNPVTLSFTLNLGAHE